MSETIAQPRGGSRAAAWKKDLDAAHCTNCGAHFLLPCGSHPAHCPDCNQAALTIRPGGLADEIFAYPPEQVIPFQLQGAALEEVIQKFIAQIPFPPTELEHKGLNQRLVPLFMPMWLVDADTMAYWKTEAGYDYKVLSHQEYLNVNNQWQTQEVREARVRWEPRLGRLKRDYRNVTVPAIGNSARLEEETGPFDLSAAQSYSPDFIQQMPVRLPDTTPKECWSETVAAFQRTAEEECRKACSADRLRQFRWKAQFTRLNWTLLLLPVYTVEYLDDAGQRQSIWINGQTGKISGLRQASVRSARRTGFIILTLAAIMLFLGLGMTFLAEGNRLSEWIATLTTLLGIAGVIGSLVPIGIAWDYNNNHKPSH